MRPYTDVEKGQLLWTLMSNEWPETEARGFIEERSKEGLEPADEVDFKKDLADQLASKFRQAWYKK